MKQVIGRIVHLLLTVAFFVLVWIFVVSVTNIKDNTMSPTLSKDNIMVVNKIIYKISDVRRFDTVIFKHNKTNYVRRVLGLPGDVIKYVDNKLIVDGKQYVSEATLDLDNFSIEDFGYDKVPDKYYLVASDDKTNTELSLALIPRDEIYGRLTMRVWPFDSFGFIK